MKRFYTTKKGTLNDENKTGVLVQTFDTSTGAIELTMGMTKIHGNDIYDKYVGERIAFDKAYLTNIKKFIASYKKEQADLQRQLREVQETLAFLNKKKEKVLIDLDTYKNDQEEMDTLDDEYLDYLLNDDEDEIDDSLEEDWDD